MHQVLACLLALFFSLNCPATEGNVDFWHSALAAEGTAAQLTPRLAGNAVSGDGWRRLVYNSATKEAWVSSEEQLFHTEVLSEGIKSGGWKIGANVNEQYIGGNALFQNGQLQQWNWASGHIPGTLAVQQEAEAAMSLILKGK